MLLSFFTRIFAPNVGGVYAGNVLAAVDFGKPNANVGDAIFFSSLFGANTSAVGLAITGEVNDGGVALNENPPRRRTELLEVFAGVVTCG